MFENTEGDFSCSSIHNVSKHSLNDDDKDISLSNRDKNNEDSDDGSVLIDQKHPIKLDSDGDDKQKPPAPYKLKLSLDSTLQEAQLYLKHKLASHQREIEDLIERQMHKWRVIKDKRVLEEKLRGEIKAKEGQLAEASKMEEYDLADRLQNEINKDQGKIEAIEKHMVSLEKQKGELEAMVKAVEDRFVREVKEDVSVLMEIESRQTTERNIYWKTEEEKIGEARAALKAKEIRLQETYKEIEKKIREGEGKIRELQEECEFNAKDSIEEKNRLDECIEEIDREIEELEKKVTYLALHTF